MTDFLTFTAGSDDGFKKIVPIDDATLTCTEISPALDKEGIPYTPPGLFFFFRVDDYDTEAEDADGNEIGDEWIGYIHREKVSTPAPGTTPGPRSNLYKLAQRMMGRDILKGENINLSPLIGKQYKADIEHVDQLMPDPTNPKRFIPAVNDDGTKKKKPTIMNTIKPMRVRKPKPAPVVEEESFDWDAADS